MADCYIRTFDPNNDKTYKKTGSDRMIGLRSKYPHSEFQFSARYKGVSVSATMADDCRCVRPKHIDFDKHPARWRTQVVPLTNKQEDAIFLEACKLADLSWTDAIVFVKKGAVGDVCFGPEARKYDLCGVVVCNVLRWRLIRSNDRWFWCSELVCHLVQIAYPNFNGHPDTQTPETLYDEWEAYSNAG